MQLWRAHTLHIKDGRMALPQEMNPGQGDGSSELAHWPVEQSRTACRQFHRPSLNTLTWHVSGWLAGKVSSFHFVVLQLGGNLGGGSVLLLAHGSVCRILQSSHGHAQNSAAKPWFMVDPCLVRRRVNGMGLEPLGTSTDTSLVRSSNDRAPNHRLGRSNQTPRAWVRQPACQRQGTQPDHPGTCTW